MVTEKWSHFFILHSSWGQGAEGTRLRFERQKFTLYNKESELCLRWRVLVVDKKGRALC